MARRKKKLYEPGARVPWEHVPKQGVVMKLVDMSSKFAGCAALFLGCFMVLAPVQAQDVAPQPPATQATSSPTTTNEDYQLGTGDKVRVVVFGEEDLGGEYVVDGSGFVRMPLIGQLNAAGLSVRDFEAEVKAKLDDGFMKDARVSVQVTSYRPFYIIGEVNKPGEYPYVNNMSVLNAVALAGGYTYRANESDVYIQHNGQKNEEIVPADQNTKVNPGDIIRVPERFF